MTKYEYHRIGHLRDKLGEAGIARKTIGQIMRGGEAIRRGAKPEEKADWMREAMRRMDRLLDKQTRYAVREACACCLGGWRLKTAKAIAKEHQTLEGKIKAVHEKLFKLTIQEDGRILVCFSPEGQAHYRWVIWGQT